MSLSEAGSRLSKTDIDDFVTQLFSEVQISLPLGDYKLERGPSIWAGGYRLWVTLLDDASPGQLRVRKLVLAIRDEPRENGQSIGRGQFHWSREWYSTDPTEDRWQDMEAEDDRESTSAAVLEVVRDEFLRTVGVRRASATKPS